MVESPRDREEGRGFFRWTFENILLFGRGKNKNIFNGAIRQTWLSLGNLLVVWSAQLCLGGVFFVSVVSYCYYYIVFFFFFECQMECQASLVLCCHPHV